MFTEQDLIDIIKENKGESLWDKYQPSDIIKGDVAALAQFSLDLVRENKRLFKLYVNTSEAVLELEKENNQFKEDLALIKLLNLAKKDVENNKVYSVNEALELFKAREFK